MADVLVAGVYLVDRENSAAHVMYELAGTRRHRVVQRWIALAPAPSRGTTTTTAPSSAPAILPYTTRIVDAVTPKFALIDELVADGASFDFVVVVDDDVELGAGFVDAYLAAVAEMDLALSQPARTSDSHIDHRFVMQMPGIRGRTTRFVEIGPLFCARRDAFPLIFPVGDVGMGWGLDFVWPVVLEDAGLRLGIVDAVPIAHRLRKQVTNYAYREAAAQMEALLSRRPHLDAADAFTIGEVW